jgi:hypothetical protein
MMSEMNEGKESSVSVASRSTEMIMSIRRLEG